MAPPSRRVKSPATKPSQTLDVTTLRKVPRAAIFKNLAMLQLATLSHQVYELCLTPVYGSISSAAVNLDNLLVILLWLTIMFPPQRMLNVARLVPILGCLAPVIQSILYKYSGRMGPQQGPLLSYSITSFPILSLSLFINIEFIIRVVSNNTDTHKLADSGYVHAGLKSIAILLLVYAFSQLMTVLKGTANFVLTVLPSITDIASSRFGLHALMVTLWALFARSKATLFLGVLSIVCITFLVPHLPTTNNIRFINTNLLSSGYSLVARQESLTGYISVLDNLKDGFRVMRCDHSLLGGEWINKPEGHPAKFNEPIYSIFVMLEAVRLVETQSSRKMEEKLDSEKQALVIGLGIGTAPSALIAHGIETTAVEIDPVVHEFATRYFNLPLNHTSIIGDAVNMVDEMHTGFPKKTYDYIIHDVFTGGAEPIDLFTQEFLNGLSNLISPGGTIAINYAGDLLLPSAISVITTVLSVFPNCRLFREVPIPVPMGKEDFTNLVIFCKNTTETFTFRIPNEADFLGSPARRQHLVPQNEILDARQTVEGKGRIIRRGQTRWLEASQLRSARGHWHVMRAVLPDIVWETW